MEVEPQGSARPRGSGPESSDWPVLAGALTFLGSLGLGLVVTIIVVRSTPPPYPAEVNEAYADAMARLCHVAFGAAISLLVAAIAAGIVAARVRQGE
jgi:hypothetical protein